MFMHGISPSSLSSHLTIKVSSLKFRGDQTDNRTVCGSVNFVPALII